MSESPQPVSQRSRARFSLWRVLVEVGCIVFLYYSNLLMGEFEGSGLGQRNGFFWALNDIFTPVNVAIALVTALVGFLGFEFLRKKF